MLLPDLSDPRIVLFYTIAFSILGLAALFGGKPERWGVAVLLLMLVVQRLVVALITGADTYDQLDPASLAGDLTGLIGFTIIMSRARRLWPIVAWALQFLTLVGHLLQSSTFMAAYSYVSFKSWPTLVVIVLMGLAAIAHRWRLHRNGEDLDWVPYKSYRQFRTLTRELQDL